MHKAILYLVGFIFYIPFLHIPYRGSDLLLRPSNILILISVVIIIAAAALLVFKKGKILIYRPLIFLFSFPLGIGISAFFNTPYDIDTLIRLVVILGAIVFLISMLQFQMSKEQISNLLWIILVSMMLDAVVACIQMLPGHQLAAFIPHPSFPRPAGILLQANLTASLHATAIILALYKVSSKDFQERSFILRWIAYLTIGLSSFIITASGSRIGLLSMIVTIPLIVYSRHDFLWQEKKSSCIAFIFLISGIICAPFITEGLDRSIYKLMRLSDGVSDLRLHIYAITFSIFMENPITGHGIGTFPRLFFDHAIQYTQAHPEYSLKFHDYFAHPHNEILFQAVEGGLITLLGLTIFCLIIFIQLIRNGRLNGGSQAALLIPVTLHSLVEFPLYMSLYHLIMAMLLIYLVFMPHIRPFAVPRLRYTILSFGFLILISGLLFFSDTLKSSRKIINFTLFYNIDLEALEEAQQNPYFSEIASVNLMKAKMSEDITNQTSNWTVDNIEWIEHYIEKIPDLSLFHDLAISYALNKETEKAYRVSERAEAYYKHHPVIELIRERIQLIDANDGVWPKRQAASPDTQIDEPVKDNPG